MATANALKMESPAFQTANVVDIEERQVELICSLFEAVISFKDSTANDFSMAPLAFRFNKTRIGSRKDLGVCDVVEIHGFYTEATANKAIFHLRDYGTMDLWSKDPIIELVKNKTGDVTAIRFVRPVLHTTK